MGVSHYCHAYTATLELQPPMHPHGLALENDATFPLGFLEATASLVVDHHLASCRHF